jgi:RNA polymerase sigma-70 factor (ECF subfamily)
VSDEEIIALYEHRNEQAIEETSKKYGHYCRTISFNILHNDSDVGECLNDTYLRVWNVIPPERPKVFPAFIGRIIRNLSLNKFQKSNAEKRGFGQTELVYEELQEYIAGSDSLLESKIDGSVITQIINSFLSELNTRNRKIFVSRYWYLLSIENIAESFGLTVANTKKILQRSREKLKEKLEKEGMTI